MASVLKVDKLDPQSGTALELGTSGDTVSLPSGATLDISASTLTPPATMPASSGINFTALNATNLGSGTVPTARLGTGTASSSTVLYGDQTYKAEPGGGITDYDVWYLTTTFTGNASPIASNLASLASAGTGHLGSAMTESSGIFTFPSTGFWQIIFEHYHYLNGDNAYVTGTIHITTNNSTYTEASAGSRAIPDVGVTAYASGTEISFFDVTDTTNCKVQFRVINQDTATSTIGNAAGVNQMHFIRMADT